MYSNEKWISKVMFTMLVAAVLAPAGLAQIHVIAQPNSLLPADEARDIFNAGQAFFDESRFADAENKFREVVRRFPRNPIADRADYYLIRTLTQAGRKNEALVRINGFARQYPKSKWLDDVQEMRIQLTNQVPARAEYILLRTAAPAAPPSQTPQPPQAPQGPSPAPAPFPTVRVTGPVVPPLPPMPPMRPAPFAVSPLPFGAIEFQSSDPEISLQQEMMRAFLRTNFDRAIEIALERLKADPADPVVLSSLNVVAASHSAQAASVLLGIAKSSTNAKARRDAIFWLGQSRGDKDAIVDTLTGLLPSLSDDDSEAVTYALSQLRTDKSLNALATIARDKSKNEKARNNALFWIAQSRVPNRVGLLEDIYKNSMDNSKFRQQIMFALSQTREAQAVTILGTVASTDPDIEVRKQAVYWLGQSRSPEAGQTLEKLLQKK